jgi:hypothetical protein
MVAVRRSFSSVVFFCIVFCMASAMAFGSASNIYITQNGSPSGNCTANVLTPAFFNNAANWGSGSGQIGPGTTVLLCGTITFPANSSGLTVQGSGASGNPVTIKFDTNAILQSPAFAGTWNTSGGGIDIERVSYVTVDGNNLTGIVQNTQNGSPSVTCSNGSACAYQNSSYGIKIRAANNITVQNLTITSIYNQCGAQGSSCTDVAGLDTADIGLDGAGTSTSSSNILITGNYLAKSRTGVGATFAATNISGLEIANNTFNDHGWHMTIQGANANVATNVLIHDNDISNFADWAAPWAPIHTDGIITFTGSTPGTPTYQPYIYNNNFHGGFNGSYSTAYVYCSGPDDGASSTVNESCHVFNNVFETPDDTTAIWIGANTSILSGTHYIYNNTFVGPCSSASGFALVLDPNPGKVNWQNNVTYNYGVQMTSYATTQGAFFAQIASSNHNVWNSTCTLGFNYDFGGSGVIQGYSTWQSAGGFDPNSTTANPNLSGTYTLGSGSSAIGLGTNMTSSCSGSFAPLCTDKAGTPRPSSGGWDAGAYQFSSAGGAPAPPTGLAAIIQ